MLEKTQFPYFSVQVDVIVNQQQDPRSLLRHQHSQSQITFKTEIESTETLWGLWQDPHRLKAITEVDLSTVGNCQGLQLFLKTTSPDVTVSAVVRGFQVLTLTYISIYNVLRGFNQMILGPSLFQSGLNFANLPRQLVETGRKRNNWQ